MSNLTERQIIDGAPRGWTHYAAEHGYLICESSPECSVFNAEHGVWLIIYPEITDDVRSRKDIERIAELEFMLDMVSGHAKRFEEVIGDTTTITAEEMGERIAQHRFDMLLTAHAARL